MGEQRIVLVEKEKSFEALGRISEEELKRLGVRYEEILSLDDEMPTVYEVKAKDAGLVKTYLKIREEARPDAEGRRPVYDAKGELIGHLPQEKISQIPELIPAGEGYLAKPAVRRQVEALLKPRRPRATT